MMKWFAVHRTFTLIVAIVLLLVILLIVSYSLKDKDNAVGDVASSIVAVVQKPFSAVTGAIGNALGGAFSNDELAKQNKELQQKVDELSDELTVARIDAEELAELKKLSESLNGVSGAGERKLVAANLL
ncbi:MAG: hypothetical protein LBL36_05945, partial [Clostridiales Family XIII bacterium]|nr:hypothetical protein [Clostridiales Family XIII bacterium]